MLEEFGAYLLSDQLFECINWTRIEKICITQQEPSNSSSSVCFGKWSEYIRIWKSPTLSRLLNNIYFQISITFDSSSFWFCWLSSSKDWLTWCRENSRSWNCFERKSDLFLISVASFCTDSNSFLIWIISLLDGLSYPK